MLSFDPNKILFIQPEFSDLLNWKYMLTIYVYMIPDIINYCHLKNLNIQFEF